MFEVNFFEKKQRNFLPYVLSGAFLFLLVLVGVYFFRRKRTTQKRKYVTGSGFRLKKSSCAFRGKCRSTHN